MRQHPNQKGPWKQVVSFTPEFFCFGMIRASFPVISLGPMEGSRVGEELAEEHGGCGRRSISFLGRDLDILWSSALYILRKHISSLNEACSSRRELSTSC